MAEINININSNSNSNISSNKDRKNYCKSSSTWKIPASVPQHFLRNDEIRSHNLEESRLRAELKYKRKRSTRTTNSGDDDDDETNHCIPRFNDLPRFFADEIHSGRKLGNGAFGIVCEVKGISLFHQQQQEEHENSKRNNTARLNPAARAATARHFEEGGDGGVRYAIKGLRHKIICGNTSIFVQSMVDIATETRVLASLPHHPNIIQLHGMAATISPFHEDFFLLLDRLFGTLEDRLKYWNRQERFESNKVGRVLWPALEHRRSKHRRERLVACRDLASALAHLHRHGIIHRDIKPKNIGFNARGDLTLFDFGFSREIPSTSDSDSNRDQLFNLTGFCGSPRYMAPEVGLRQPYNASCDVYSFGVLAWEILTLQLPYKGCELRDMKLTIWPGKGNLRGPCDWNNNGPCGTGIAAAVRNHRPKPIPHKALAAVIDETWNREISLRPTMSELEDCLRDECEQFDERNNTNKDTLRRLRDESSSSSSPVEPLLHNNGASKGEKPTQQRCRRHSSVSRSSCCLRRRSSFVVFQPLFRLSSSSTRSCEHGAHHCAYCLESSVTTTSSSSRSSDSESWI